MDQNNSKAEKGPSITPMKKLFFAAVMIMILILSLEMISKVLYRVRISRYIKAALNNLFDPREGGAMELRYRPHHYLVYELNPDFRNKDGVRIHNRDGFRGREIEAVKASGTRRIFCLGGSTTYTSKVDNEELTYPRQLEKFLNSDADLGAFRYEVINGGVGGYTSAETLIQLIFKIMRYDPDIIVLYNGINDIFPRLWAPGPVEPDYGNYRKIWDFYMPGPFMLRLLRVSDLAKIIYIKTHGDLKTLDINNITAKWEWKGPDKTAEYLKKSPPDNYENNVRHMVHICRGRKVRLIFVTPADDIKDFNTWGQMSAAAGIALDQHRTIMKKLGMEFDIPVIDFSRYYSGKKKYFADSVHVNSEGAKEKARYIYLNMKQYLTGRNIRPGKI